MNYLDNLVFINLLIAAVVFFSLNVKRLKRNIYLGKKIDRTDQPKERLKNMLLIAFGQSRMVKRPIAGLLHVIVYVGFIVINLEVLEIIIDGIVGTHRVFSFMGRFYQTLIGAFEILALLVLVSVIIFWTRRNIQKIKRFWNPEMKGWPKKDANMILYIEAVLMLLFLTMNAADFEFQLAGGGNVISSYLAPIFAGFGSHNLHMIERTAWWLHIAGILYFLNYLYYSKHLHILLAFPNTYFANLKPYGKFSNLESVTKEVKLMLDPTIDPFAVAPSNENTTSEKFGASDVFDLNRIQLLNAYTCTECGRCTSVCPANITGKKLSPRKIMMDTRDRIEKIGRNMDRNGKFVPDNKTLLNDYITPEEIWACTSCNACVEACPVNIDPLSIIIDLRRYLVMEQSAAPSDLNTMMANIENNGAPWPFNQQDRLNWKDNL
ncbi:MAG: Fe-S oxidoreductase [Flavobacteriales bacterium CG_4_9_14_3_um_filter_40_17]|nr:MAG: Fe-S oxidoreductase [Flavobacteriales bacterium CG_4_9_14_3_um_filter_40_17]